VPPARPARAHVAMRWDSWFPSRPTWDYYRCYRCANVWIMPKDEPEPSASATISLNVER